MKKAGLSTFEQIGLDIVGETAGDGFGAAVSLSANGSALVVGAPSNNGNGCVEIKIPSSSRVPGSGEPSPSYPVTILQSSITDAVRVNVNTSHSPEDNEI